MCELSRAQHFCDINGLPDDEGYILFTQSPGHTFTGYPFAWADTLPALFQPYRILAVCMETKRQLKATGLGGRQLWREV